jgi:farnesyl diphosphate synthase
MSGFVTQAGPLRELVESELAKLFTPEGFLTDGNVPPGLVEPMRYALLGGGKRLRPVLCLAVCQAVCGDPAPALPAALAIEVLHNSTLVHDALPCMDDDAMRGGRPTVHARYGYAQAVLVGDALQAAAFDLALTPPRSGVDGVASRSGWGAALQLRLARTFAAAIGPSGVVGGKWVDVTSAAPHDEARIVYVHAHKTGDMIECAANLGAIAAGASTRVLLATADYGRSIGIALQIVDDLLDVGDPAKADELSILRVCTPDEARARARAATERAIRAVPAIGDAPDAAAPGIQAELSKAFSGVRGAMASLGAAETVDSTDSAKAAALALLRALAEDQLSRMGYPCKSERIDVKSTPPVCRSTGIAIDPFADEN